MSASSHTQFAGSSLPLQELVLSVEDMLEKASEFQAGLRKVYSTGKLTDREMIFGVVNSLSGPEYRTVYRMIRPLGFTPSLMPDAERDEKEKRRVATFLSRLFDQLQPSMDALFSKN